jgi:hypothetical protein
MVHSGFPFEEMALKLAKAIEDKNIQINNDQMKQGLDEN